MIVQSRHSSTLVAAISPCNSKTQASHSQLAPPQTYDRSKGVALTESFSTIGKLYE
jgi:hypothetical protein